ncbi:hypothetical protein [Streptomyces prasinus]
MSDLKQSKTEWTEDNWHKVCGEFTFHPCLRCKMRDKKVNGVPIWGVEVPDLEHAWWEPEFEFAYDIWTANVVSSALPTVLNQRGEHPVRLFAAVYTESQWQETHRKPTLWFEDGKMRSYTHRETVPMRKEIPCDSGKYYVSWSIVRTEHSGTRDRQPYGGPNGDFVWDSNAERIKREIAINQNVYG